MVPKLPLNAKVYEKNFFQRAISRKITERDTKSGSKIEDFCENLIVSPFLSKSTDAYVLFTNAAKKLLPNFENERGGAENFPTEQIAPPLPLPTLRY